MCVVTKSLRKREDAPTVYLAVDVDATKCRNNAQCIDETLPGGLKKAFISGIWEQKPHFEENGRNQDKMRNREHSCFGEQGNKSIYFRGTCIPLGGPHI